MSTQTERDEKRKESWLIYHAMTKGNGRRLAAATRAENREREELREIRKKRRAKLKRLKDAA